MSGCAFVRTDGNAVHLDKYNRNATITYNEFVWLGSTAIAVWGNTDGGDPRLPEGYGIDGTAGNQPRGTYIAFNLCHEYGIWEKQSSFVTQFKTDTYNVRKRVVDKLQQISVDVQVGYENTAL